PRVRLDAEPGLEVAIAAEAFDAALTHLIDNAVEASPPDAPVAVVLRRGRASAVIEITDRGPGMSAEFIRDVLFRPLGTAGKAAGSGIGAWQARELVREAGGELEVLSTPGQGTTMRVTLPLVARQGGEPAPSVEEKAA
ncbi:MAG: ATP-binding protein, partial [Elioraea sp.]|nr:ATP-binding protein [Elioraea sp.]